MSNELHRAYRPETWDEFVGNEKTVDTIRKRIGETHFFLFHGQRGCGKTTLARLVAKEMGVGELDLYEIDAASNRGIDQAKALKGTFRNKAMDQNGSGKKMYIFDEAHRLTPEAEDSLLKALEEPPDHVFFVFCTTELKKVATTIRSRAAKFQVRPLPRRDAVQFLLEICQEEKVDLPDRVLTEIHSVAEGIPREMLILLDQVMDMEDPMEYLETLAGTDATFKELVTILMGSKKNKWKEVAPILEGLLEEQEPEDIRRGILGYLAAVAKNTDQPSPALLQLSEMYMDNLYDSGKAGLILITMQACML